MLDTVKMLAILVTIIHAFTYARWLKQNGNPLGTTGVMLVIIVAIAVPIYRMLKPS